MKQVLLESQSSSSCMPVFKPHQVYAASSSISGGFMVLYVCPLVVFWRWSQLGTIFISLPGLNPRLSCIVPRKWAEITCWDDCLNNLLLEDHSLCAFWSDDEEGSRTLLHSSTLKNISTTLSVTGTNFVGHPNVLLPCVQWLMWSVSYYPVFFFLSGAKTGLAFVAGDREAPGISWNDSSLAILMHLGWLWALQWFGN